MEFFRKIFRRAEIEEKKKRLQNLVQNLAPFANVQERPKPVEEKFSKLPEEIQQLGALSLEALLLVPLEIPKELPPQILMYWTKYLESQGERGSRTLRKLLFSPHYQNHPSLAAFIRPFLSLAPYAHKKELQKLFHFHKESIPIRSAIIEALARTSPPGQYDELFSLLEKTTSSEALDLFFALRPHILPQHLRKYETRICSFLSHSPLSSLGYYLLGYLRKFDLLEKQAISPDVHLLLSYSLFASREKLKAFYHKVFRNRPSLLLPFLQIAVEKSVFSPQKDQQELATLLKGKSLKVATGLDGLKQYRPEFISFLLEFVKELPRLSLPQGLEVLSAIEKLQEPRFVPHLVLIYPEAPDLQGKIVQVVYQLEKSERLEEILEHFQRRTKSSLVSDQIKRTLEAWRKEKRQQKSPK